MKQQSTTSSKGRQPPGEGREVEVKSEALNIIQPYSSAATECFLFLVL